MWRWGRRSNEGDEADRTPDTEPALSDEALLGLVADKICRRGLAVPAILFLESSKPLSFIGSQCLVFMEPFVKTFFSVRHYDRFAEMMEDRANVERLLTQLEAREAERRDDERAKRKAKES